MLTMSPKVLLIALSSTRFPLILILHKASSLLRGINFKMDWGNEHVLFTTLLKEKSKPLWHLKKKQNDTEAQKYF